MAGRTGSTLLLLQGLSAELDMIVQNAARASTALRDTEDAGRAASEGSGRVIAAVEQAAATVRSRSSDVRRDVESAVAAVAEGTSQIQRTVEQVAQPVATVLDDLLVRVRAVAGAGNLWSQEFVRQVEAVKLGILDIEQLIRTWGDAKVATEDGVKTVRQLLDGLDLRAYEQQLHDFTVRLHEGTIEIDRILDFLGEHELIFAKQLKEVIELFLQGKVTLEAVERVIRGIQAQFKGSDFAQLADALGQRLAQGGFR